MEAFEALVTSKVVEEVVAEVEIEVVATHKATLELLALVTRHLELRLRFLLGYEGGRD